MNKHERAVQLIGYQIVARRQGVGRTPEAADKDETDALTYALRVLEAVDGVEEWMVERLVKHATFIRHNYGKDDAQYALDIRTILQAILDAKGEGGG